MTSALSMGDLAQTRILRQANASLRADLDRLGQEVVTGRAADLTSHVRGDLTGVASVEHGLKLADAFGESRRAAAAMATAQQAALGRVADMVTEIGPGLIEASAVVNQARITAMLEDTSQKFTTSVALLNGSFGGRALFAGVDTSGTALADPEVILADLASAVAGATTADDVMAAAETWFMSAGGGFETDAYLGAAEPIAPFDMDESESVALEATALDPALRRGLLQLAVGALMHDGLFANDLSERQALLSQIGIGSLNAVTDLANLRGSVGTAEQTIERASARGSARTAALEFARNNLVGIDQYESAARLEQVRVQLESIYSLTARLSGLSLARVLQ